MQLPVMFLNFGGQPVAGYYLVWHHRYDMSLRDPINNQRYLIHYYEHHRRVAHDITPTMVPNGRHRAFWTLRYGLQINHFRSARGQ